MDRYPVEYFYPHRAGLFRRKVPIHQLLRFSKDSLRLPLLLVSKEFHKDALKAFKLIQCAMGDRKSNITSGLLCDSNVEYPSISLSELHDIITTAIAEFPLRDEIYMQLCKQLTFNPNVISQTRGWHLLSIFVQFFCPSKTLIEYLNMFLAANSNVQLTAFVSRHIQRVTVLGNRGAPPKIEEVTHSIDAPWRFSVFGSSLDEICSKDQQKYPKVLVFLCKAIEKCNGFHTEGIFRIPCDYQESVKLRIQIEKEEYNIESILDPHVPAGVLKFWFRDLKYPLIINYEDAMRASFDGYLPVLSIVQNLPESHRNTVMFLVTFLQRMAANESSNKMSINNLSMIFSPSFLRCPSDDPKAVLNNAKSEQSFVKILLENSKYSIEDLN